MREVTNGLRWSRAVGFTRAIPFCATTSNALDNFVAQCIVPILRLTESTTDVRTYSTITPGLNFWIIIFLFLELGVCGGNAV